jgi:Mn-containing catalase
MFYHVKELQFNARVSGPDPAFATLLLDQFGGSNGELKAAMQYFVQAFAARKPYPDKYDLLMDTATEELSHLEIVGATITMLLDGLNGELKNAVEPTYLSNLMNGKGKKEEMLHAGLVSPAFLVLTGGGPGLTDSNGFPWQGYYVTANGDLTVDLRSNIAAESRAKIVYEYLLQFTDDPDVKETLRFLMTREIAHFQQFTAALDDIQPNFPPGIRQGDPRYTHVAFNTSGPDSMRGPWNKGQGPWQKGEQWVYIEEPIQKVRESQGLVDQPVEGTKKTEDEVETMNQKLSEMRSSEIKNAVGKGKMQWSTYGEDGDG